MGAPEELLKCPPNRQAAMGNLKKAAKELEAAVKHGVVGYEDGMGGLNQITDIARELAVQSIAQTTGVGGEPNEILKAEKSLAEGDELRAEEKFEKAVAKAEKSWMKGSKKKPKKGAK